MAELDHTIVSIRFSGANIDPKKIAEMLGFIESKSTRSTVKRSKNGCVVWSVELESNENMPIEKKIESLLAKFTNEINDWKQATSNVKADIFCGLFLDGWNRGFNLTSKLMKELSDRNLEVGFDIYSPTDSWEA